MPKNILKSIFVVLFIITGALYAQTLSESFDGPAFPPPGWVTYDNVLDYWIHDRNGPHVAPGCAFAGKFGGNPHTPSDAWLVTPPLQPTDGHNTLEFWYRGFNKNHYESLEVWVSKAGQDYASFMNPVTGIRVAWIGMKTWDYTKYTLSLAPFNNQIIYVAFRYVGINPNRHGVFLDEVKDWGGGGVTTPSRDVGVTAIIRPDTLELPEQFFPQATIRNFGSQKAENFWTRCVIETITGARVVYRDSVLVDNLSAAASRDLNFAGFNRSGGYYRVKFKTLLVGDVNKKNDSMMRNFKVLTAGYKDAGVSAIITPMGEVLYNSVHYPTIQVRNYSAQAEQIPATVQIKRVTTQEIVYTGSVGGDIIQPLKSKVYVLPTAWTATVGVYEIIAYTTLANDQDKSNDTMRAGTVCSNIDVAVLSIENPQAPFAVVEPGQTVIPKARVANFGWQEQTFDVTFKIGSGYSDTKSVSLDAGSDTIISFSAWQSDTFTYAMRCSTYLAEDMKPDNNVRTGSIFVPVRDLEPVVFLAPNQDTIEPVQFIPQVAIRNNGNYRIPAAPVFLAIRNSNGDTVFTATSYVNIFEYNTAIAYFGNWNPEWYGEPSIYYLDVRTVHPYDLRPSNDFISWTVYVKKPFRDVALTRINSPRDSAGLQYPIIPKVTIANEGNVPIPGFAVITEILYPDSNVAYCSTKYVTSTLLPGRTVQVTFPIFYPTRAGEHPINSYIVIEDSIPENNSKSDIFNVTTSVSRDVGVYDFVSPNSQQTPMPTGINSAIQLGVKVYNAGNVDAVNLPINFKVTRLGRSYADYDNQMNIDLPKYTSDVTVIHPVSWVPLDTGTYVIRVQTQFPGDQNLANNAKSCTVRIWIAPEYGWKNCQPAPWLVKDGGALTYVPNKGIFAFTGNKTTGFFRYDVANNNWNTLTDAPKPVGKGAALCNDGENIIYAVFGNKTKDFYKYNIADNQWIPLETIPLGRVKKNKLQGGSGLAFVPKGDSDFVFLLKGNKTYEFYAYYVQGNTWLERKSIPIGLDPKKPPEDGTSIATDGYNNIYVLKAKTNELFVYNVANDTWIRMTNANLPANVPGSYKTTTVKAGGALTHNGVDKLYAFKGGNTEFWTYKIPNGSWVYNSNYQVPKPQGAKNLGSGAAMVYALDKIYAFRGNNTADFMKFIPPIQTDQTGEISATTEAQMLTEANIGLVPIKITVRPNIISNDAVMLYYQVNDLRPITVNLYNIIGNLVKSEQKIITNKTGILSLDVSDISAGIYFLQCKTDKTTILEKVVVQK